MGGTRTQKCLLLSAPGLSLGSPTARRDLALFLYLIKETFVELSLKGLKHGTELGERVGRLGNSPSPGHCGEHNSNVGIHGPAASADSAETEN